MSKQLMRAMHVPFEIQRVNEEERTVEAYAFVNEVVDGEGGIRLKRSSMEAATPDYMNWANVRQMHTPSAVGVAKSVTWDERGARMVLEVVDDEAWKKVQRGVYKGLSVGVAPTVMRGKDVEKCRWIETSLVDRPKDPGAIITAVRSADFSEEFEVEVLEEQRAEDAETTPPAPSEEEIARGMFNDMVREQEGGTLRYFALEALAQCLYRIQCGEAADKEAQVRTVCKEFANYIVPIVARAELDEGLLSRLASAGGPRQEPSSAYEELTTRFETVTTQLAEALTRVESAEAEVERLKKQPAPKPIAKAGPVAIDRTFLANEIEASETRVSELKAELQRLSALPSTATELERTNASTRIGGIRRELAQLGH